jgi:putative transcriptional regulator
MKAKKAAVARVAPSKKRDVFAEVMEGMAALSQSREGKLTLRTHPVEYKEPPVLTPKDLVKIREGLRISRPVFAAYLRTNVRTLENWEQGRAKPNAQAALLINLVKEYPDTVQRLASI